MTNSQRPSFILPDEVG